MIEDEYVPLFPLRTGHWDKPLSELPEELQARLSGKHFNIAVGVEVGWDESRVHQRMLGLQALDRRNAPNYADE